MDHERKSSTAGERAAKGLREATAKEEAKNESKMGHDLAKGADRFEERSKSSDGKSACLSLILEGAGFFGFARRLVRPAAAPPSARSVGSSACSLKGPLDPTGRLSTTPGFAIVAATISGSSVSFATPW